LRWRWRALEGTEKGGTMTEFQGSGRELLRLFFFLLLFLLPGLVLLLFNGEAWLYHYGGWRLHV